MSNSHKLAVFISHIYGDFQSAVCEGIIEQAEAYGYQLDFYASNDENIIGDYGLGEKELFHVPNIHSYEGILCASGTYLVPSVQEALYKLLTIAKCPIIDICNSSSGFPNIGLNNISMIQTLVTHLYTTHNLSKLCYIGCSIHQHISDLRKNAYIKGMAHHKLTYDSTTMYDCEFTNSSVEQALDFFITHDSQHSLPQGIICYNDELAFIVIEELAKRGYRIPEDIAVTGCDNLNYGDKITPPLTTISFPAKELGIVAFNTLLALLDKQEVAFPIRVNAEPMIKGSCGCSYEKQNPSILFSNLLNKKIMNLESKILENIHMSGSLQNLNQLDDVIDYIETTLENYPKITDFYFFLYSNWHEVDSNLLKLLSTDTIYRPDNIDLKLGISKGQRLPSHTFMTKNAVEEFLNTHTDSIRLFTPLYFEEKSFGFLCFSYQNNHIYYPFTFVAWLQNLNMVLKDLSDQRSLQLVKEQLEDLNYKDDLTGLYNRHGFQYYSFLSLERYAVAQAPMSLVTLEIIDFQTLNSTYGLEESNFALSIFTKAILKSVSNNAVCARYRGANFQILSEFATEDDVNDLFRSIQRYLQNYKELYNLEYTISFSCGHVALKGYTEDHLYESLMHIHTTKKKF